MLPPPLILSDSEEDDHPWDNEAAELSSQHFLSSLKLLTGDSAPSSPTSQAKSEPAHAYASEFSDQGEPGKVPLPPQGLKSDLNRSTGRNPLELTRSARAHVVPSETALDSVTEIFLSGMAPSDAESIRGSGMEAMLAKIMDRLDGLSAGQRNLEAKLDALASAAAPSIPEPESLRYASFQAPATPTHPPHMSLFNGISMIPIPGLSDHGRKPSFGAPGVIGGLSGISLPSSLAAGSALSTSHEGRARGGIEALQLARRNSRPSISHSPQSGASTLPTTRSHVDLSAPSPPPLASGVSNADHTDAAGGSSDAPGSKSRDEVETPRRQDHELPGNTMWQLDVAAEKLRQKGGDGKNGTAERKERKLEEVYGRRAVLTTYPGQPGIRPYPLKWSTGPDPRERGPVICSRQPASLPYRNAIGAHTGPYSVYRALSVAMKLLPVDHRPDFTDTSPPIAIGPHESWWERDSEGIPKVVSMDPFGALSQEIWKTEYDEGLDIRPTISQTKSHLKIPELDVLYREGKLEIDGHIVVNSPELPAFPGVHQGIQVATYKISVDPVWYLPGVAARLKVEEGVLRRALFEDTGGMYPELLTRPDLKVFLPPIGGITIYVFGDPAYLSDASKELTFRPHDECNGSDVFGSDICTCRPYLTHGIFEAVKTAQRGGVGCIAYFRKEGRALGEVTKLLVYNLRKRTGDSAERYFKSTELIAGIKDQRFQDLHLPDVLAYLSITKIDNLISMSDMKHSAMVNSGVKIIKRYEIPEELMPPDSLVEIHAKINQGYFSNKKIDNEALKHTKGRGWEDIVH